MSDPISIVVFIAAAHGGSPATNAMMSAARQTLGPEARVELRAVEQLPSDADAALFGDMLRSDAVVEVTWPEQKFGRARIRLYARRSGTWIEREVTFSAADAEPERGRTVGYAFAAMMPEATAERRVVPPPPEAVAAPAPPPAPPPAARRSDDRAPIRRAATAVVAIDARSLAGYSGALLLGWGLGVRWLATPSWWPLVSMDVRRSTWAQVTMSEVRAALGASLGAELRPDVRLSATGELWISRATAQWESGGRSRWIPGIALGPELQWTVVAPLSLVMHAAAELAAGPSIVTVAGEPIATVPPLRFAASAAVRVRL